MQEIILDSDRYGIGVFILNEEKRGSNTFRDNSELMLTQADDTTLKESIISLIKDSKIVIKICSFIITDKDVFDALLHRASRKDVPIFILTQLDNSKLYSSPLLTDEELRENPSQTHIDCIKRLYDEGVHVRASTSAHAKFVISDRRVAILTSANMTSTCLTTNTESGFFLQPDDVKVLDHLFDVVFQKGTAYKKYLTAGKKKQFIVQTESLVEKNLLPVVSSSKVRFTYEQLTHNLYERILEIVSNAKHYIFLSTYSIVFIDKISNFSNAIQSAKERGVTIKIFCRGMNYKFEHLLGCNKLAELGCEIYANVNNHSKGIVSEQDGFMFTANIDGEHGLINGFEVGIQLTESQRHEFLLFHEHLIESSDYVYSNASRRELFNTYDNYEKRKGHVAPGFVQQLTVKLSKDVTNEINSLRHYPIFMGKNRNGDSYLLTGRNTFLCSNSDSIVTVKERVKNIPNLERYLVKFKELKIESL